jgi:hypothetical protein
VQPPPDASSTEPIRDGGPRSRLGRAAVVLVGVLLPQALLYGPSLVCRKVLLPLDILAQPNHYLPPDIASQVGQPQDWVLSDLVLQEEVFRRFAVERVRAGEVPLWNPYILCGAPFLAANHTAVFSPFRWLDYLWPGPWVLAWDQVLRALVAGGGAYLFFRRELSAGFVAAAVGAWCYPLCGTPVMNVNWGLGATVTWLPWVLLAVGAAVRTPGAVTLAAVALATAATQISGHAATGGHVLLTGGVYFLWRLAASHGVRGVARAPAVRAVALVTTGWLLGFMLAAPQILPTLEYLRTSRRIASRLAGTTEVPPIGPGALAQFILPDFYGSSQRGSGYMLDPPFRTESAAAGYTGLLVTLAAAPLALTLLSDRRRRGACLFWLAVAFVAMSPTLGVPGLRQFFLAPPLGTLRSNRLMFVAGFAVLCLGALGLDAMLRGGRGRRTARVGLVLAAVVGFCFAYFAFNLPEEIARRAWSEADVPQLQAWFRRAYLGGAGLCGVAVAFWLVFDSGRFRPAELAWCIGLLAVGELVVSAWDDNPECDPSLYYPPVPALAALAEQAGQGRFVGMSALPPNLGMVNHLRDVRGYDAVDPDRIVELVLLLHDPKYTPSPPFAATMWITPRRDLPLVRALGVGHVVGRGPPPANAGAGVAYAGGDYWFARNPGALPRAYVPREPRAVGDSAERLRLLGSPDFSPGDVAYLESAEAFPPGPCDADAKIVLDEPRGVDVEVDAKTAAVLVLSDRWDPGWTASVNGATAPVLRANHALRAVRVPAGKSLVRFRYEPRSFRLGLTLAATAAVALTASVAAAGWRRRAKRS